MYSLFENIAAAQFTPAPGLDADSEALLRRMLSKDPRQRPTIAEIRRMSWMQVDMDESGKDNVPVWLSPSGRREQCGPAFSGAVGSFCLTPATVCRPPYS